MNRLWRVGCADAWKESVLYIRSSQWVFAHAATRHKQQAFRGCRLAAIGQADTWSATKRREERADILIRQAHFVLPHLHNIPNEQRFFDQQRPLTISAATARTTTVIIPSATMTTTTLSTSYTSIKQFNTVCMLHAFRSLACHCHHLIAPVAPLWPPALPKAQARRRMLRRANFRFMVVLGVALAAMLPSPRYRSLSGRNNAW